MVMLSTLLAPPELEPTPRSIFSVFSVLDNDNSEDGRDEEDEGGNEDEDEEAEADGENEVKRSNRVEQNLFWL
jgi:hypothetical protein